MPDLSSTVEDEPPIAPVRTTRAKVVRESFTALRSDFETSTPPPVARPQRQEAAPATRDGGQSNVALTVGGGILLIGCIFAFLFFGYGSNKGSGSAAKPAGSSGAASAATTTDTVKAPVKAPAKPPALTVHNAIKEPVHKPVPIGIPEHRPAPVTPPREISESPARQVAPVRTHEFHQAEREPRPLPHERPLAVVPAKPAPHVEAPVHHTPHSEHASAPAVPVHHEDPGDSNPLHRLDNE